MKGKCGSGGHKARYACQRIGL